MTDLTKQMLEALRGANGAFGRTYGDPSENGLCNAFKAEWDRVIAAIAKAEEWDQQMDQDAEAGKLDFLRDEAKARRNMTDLEKEMLAALRLAHADLVKAWHKSQTSESLPSQCTINAVAEAIAKAEPPKPRRWVVEFPTDPQGDAMHPFVREGLQSGPFVVIREVKPITREQMVLTLAKYDMRAHTTEGQMIQDILRELGIEVED